MHSFKKGPTLVNIFLQYNSYTIVPLSFSNKFSDWGNLRWLGSYKSQRQNRIPQRTVHPAYFMTTCRYTCHFCWHVDAKINGLVINLTTYQSWKSHRVELRSSTCRKNEERKINVLFRTVKKKSKWNLFVGSSLDSLQEQNLGHYSQI